MNLMQKFAQETSKDEALEVLRTTSNDLITFYLHISCPCAFPRFRFLVGFEGSQYTNSLLHTFESNVLVSAALDYDPAFLIKEETNETLFSCRICKTQYTYMYDQYSINFDLTRLVLKESKALQKGAAVEFPFPLFAGLYITDGSRNEDDMQKDWKMLEEKFPQVPLREFIHYMKVRT